MQFLRQIHYFRCLQFYIKKSKTIFYVEKEEPEQISVYQTIEKNHGGIEKRKYLEDKLAVNW